MPLLSERPLAVTLEIDNPEPTSNSGVVAPEELGNPVDRGPRKYRRYSMPVDNTLVEFVATLNAGESSIWSGQIVLVDYSNSGLAVSRALGTVSPDTVIRIKFGVDPLVSPNSPDVYANAPLYEGRILEMHYDLRPEGVMITLQLVGQTVVAELETSGGDLKLWPRDRRIADGKQGKHMTVGSYTETMGSVDDLMGRSGTRLPNAALTFPHTAFYQLALVMGWPKDSLDVEEVTGSAAEYCQLQHDILPEPNETGVSAAIKLAAASAGPLGDPYKFYITPGANGKPIYHFHTTTYRKNAYVAYHFGGTDGNVLRATIDSSMAWAAHLGASYLRVETADSAGLDSAPGDDPAKGTTDTFFKVERGRIVDAAPVSAPDSSDPGVSNIPSVTVSGAASKAEKFQRMAAYLQRLREVMMVINLDVVGTHTTKPYDLIEFFYYLRGEKHFSSSDTDRKRKYRVLEVTHRISKDSGWVTSLNKAYSEEIPENFGPFAAEDARRKAAYELEKRQWTGNNAQVIVTPAVAQARELSAARGLNALGAQPTATDIAAGLTSGNPLRIDNAVPSLFTGGAFSKGTLDGGNLNNAEEVSQYAGSQILRIMQQAKEKRDKPTIGGGK